MANEERELSVSAQCKLGGWDSLITIRGRFAKETKDHCQMPFNLGTCVTAMAPAPVRPTSSKLEKVNFPSETVILFLLKYLIFKINKINSLSLSWKIKQKL